MTNADKIHPVAKIWISARNSVKSDMAQKIMDNYKLKALYDQDPKQQIPTCQEILNSMNSSLIKPPNSPWEIRYCFKKITGVTKIYLHNKYDINKPCFIHHHGLGEIKQVSIRLFADDRLYKKFNVFSIEAAHHSTFPDIIRNCTNTFPNFACTLCSSVLAINETVSFHKNNSSMPIIITGFSLGGMAASLHYFLFNTADYYFPVISYPNLGEIILDPQNKKMIHDYEKMEKNKSIKLCFDIPKDLKNKPKNKVFPILSRHDELINFKKAKSFWKNYQTKVFDTGHASIFLRIKEVRNYIYSKIED